MESSKIINPGRPVWISYIGNSSENPEWEHIADCVDTLVQLFKENGVEYCVNDIPENGDTISQFEKKIGMYSQVIVLVFSDRYFRSLHCMYQLVQIKKAIQKYPNKRLFCIKSGSFNLSDINYILDLEKYWGEKKQVYEEVSYHKLRRITEIEHGAYTNGFYMDDVRSLYSFFSTLNYANASSQDWNHLVNEITTCYTSPSKFFEINKQKAKKQKTIAKFAFLGCLSIFWVLFIVLIIILGITKEEVINNPKTTKEIEGLKIRKIEYYSDYLEMFLTLQNIHNKDTIVYASNSFYIEANNKKYTLDESTGIPIYNKYKVLAPNDKISFSLSFNYNSESIDSLNLIFQQGVGLFGIKLKDENKKDFFSEEEEYDENEDEYFNEDE